MPSELSGTLRWRSQTDSDGHWRILRPTPESNPGFTETGCYSFEKPGSGWHLRVDDEPLADEDGSSCWIWSPGFYAGEVTAELARDDGPGLLFLLDVSPNPAKLGRDTFRQMMDDLWAADPTLVIGTEPATHQMGAIGQLEDPWAAFMRLRQHAAEFLKALRPVCAHPRRTLRMRREAMPLHRIRRVDRRTVQTIIRSPAVALLTEADTSHGFSNQTRLDVPVVEDSLDSAANRAMLALIQAVLRRSRALLERLEQEVARAAGSDTRTPLHQRWPARRRFLVDLAASLHSIGRRLPFVDVRGPEITASGLTAVAADPTYARAWSTGWRAIRHGIQSGPSTDRLWVSPSWEIYERWCFVRLGQLLERLVPGWSWQWLRNPHRWLGARDGRRAVLTLQPTFPARDVATGQRWSVSRQREPDIVLFVDEPDGTTRFVVFDAKYRVTRPAVLDAMESAHLYQDSLRVGARRPEASLLLVPQSGGTPWLEDEAFQRAHRVGVLQANPEEPDQCPWVVSELLMPHEIAHEQAAI